MSNFMTIDQYVPFHDHPEKLNLNNHTLQLLIAAMKIMPQLRGSVGLNHVKHYRMPHCRTSNLLM